MENQKKSKGMTALVVLLLIVTIAALILATYAWAKYTSSTNNTATANVAKWNVSFTDSNSSFKGTYNHIVDGYIAPGTSGTFTVGVVPGNTEVCFNYTISVTGIKFLNESGTELAESTVLKAGGKTNGQDITLADLKSHIVITCDGQTLSSGQTVTGTYDLTNHNATNSSWDTTTKTVTWNWAYEGSGDDYDKIDTAAGEYCNSTTRLRLKVEYSVVATQIDPATPIS